MIAQNTMSVKNVNRSYLIVAVDPCWFNPVLSIAQVYSVKSATDACEKPFRSVDAGTPLSLPAGIPSTVLLPIRTRFDESLFVHPEALRNRLR